MVFFFKDHAIIFRLKLTTWYKGRGLTNVPQFWFQIWLGSLSYSVFDPVGASAAVTGVISNKKLQILPKGGKGGKGTHSQQSQLPPRGVWKTWWMQWMDLSWTEKCLGLFIFALCVSEPTYFRNKILKSTVILICLFVWSDSLPFWSGLLLIQYNHIETITDDKLGIA